MKTIARCRTLPISCPRPFSPCFTCVVILSGASTTSSMSGPTLDGARRRPKRPSPGAANPKISHVVVILKENHTFDNYFGTFPGANGVTLPRSPNPPHSDPNHTHAAWLTRATTSVRQQVV